MTYFLLYIHELTPHNLADMSLASEELKYSQGLHLLVTTCLKVSERSYLDVIVQFYLISHSGLKEFAEHGQSCCQQNYN